MQHKEVLKRCLDIAKEEKFMAKSILSYVRVDYSSLIPDGIILTEPPKSFYEFKDGIQD